MNPRARSALRVGGSAALIAAVLMLLPAGSLSAALMKASPSVLVFAATSFLVCHLVAAFKWRTLLSGSVDLSMTSAVRAHFAGLVANLSPMGLIGGDIVRAGVAIRTSSRPAAIMVTSVIDRVVDTVALMLLASGGFLWIGGRSTAAGTVLAGSVVVAGVGVAAAAVVWWIVKRSGTARMSAIRDAFEVLIRRPGLVMRVLLMSVLVQGALLAVNAYIGTSVGVECSLAAWFVAWPIAKLVAFLPVGVAGIGVREAALIALLGPLGGAAGPVMAAGLLWDAVLIVSSIGGWLMLRLLPSGRPAVPRSVQAR